MPTPSDEILPGGIMYRAELLRQLRDRFWGPTVEEAARQELEDCVANIRERMEAEFRRQVFLNEEIGAEAMHKAVEEFFSRPGDCHQRCMNCGRLYHVERGHICVLPVEREGRGEP